MVEKNDSVEVLDGDIFCGRLLEKRGPMKSLVYLLIFFSFSASAGLLEILQYPENRNYTSRDTGMRPYLAKSLYQTNTFTMTFDDGPHLVNTPKVLDVLKKHGIKATFFVLTNNLSESTYPLIKRMLDEGHIVGSHGPAHDNSNTLTESQWKGQLRDSITKLASFYQRAGYEFSNIYYRYPYGAYGGRSEYHHMNALQDVSRELFGDNCIQFAFWDVDTVDWLAGMTSQEIAQNIIAHNEGGRAVDFLKRPDGTFGKQTYLIKNPPAGGVILDHDIHAPTAGAVELFLNYAEARSVKIVRIDEVAEFRVNKHCQLNSSFQ
jgi:peptidoglycan/xylan/chitin deacetylase (PgdA/CDA1 family)